MTFNLNITTTDLLLLFFIIELFLIAKNKFAYDREASRLGFMKLSVDVEEIDNTIDKFIEICLNEYLAYNPQLQNEVYINEHKEKDIVAGVAKLVVDRISPVLFDRLSLVYAAENIRDVISRKVYMRVVIYEMEHEQYKKQEIERVNAVKENLPESP